MTTTEKQYSPSRDDFEKLLNEVHADDQAFVAPFLDGLRKAGLNVPDDGGVAAP